MSFNPFGGFPAALTALPHFAVNKFQQSHDPSFMLPTSQGLQISVGTVDTSQLNSNVNSNFHLTSSNNLQLQNQVLNSLFGKTNQNDVFVKMEPDRVDSPHLQQQQQLNHEKNSIHELNSFTEYLARFSGQPTFPYQPMPYKYPADLFQIASQCEDQQQQQQSILPGTSTANSEQQPQQHQQHQTHQTNQTHQTHQLHQQHQQPQQEAESSKRSKKKKKSQDSFPGLQMPKRRSTSLQPSLTTASDGSITYGCPQCHVVFDNRDAIDTHLAIHRSERPFICADCGAALKRKEHLDRHRSSHMTERPHLCSVCNKTFKRAEHLQRHAIIHRTDKVHRCNECGKGFNRKDHLTKHIHSHLTKKIKQELGQQAAKANLQAQQQHQHQQPVPDAAALLTQSILAQLHA